MLRAYFEVTKPKTVALLSFVGIVAGVVAYLEVDGGIYPLMFSSAAVILGSMGTNAITCYIDRDIDYIMERTRRRPIPRGDIRPPEKALAYGIALVGIAVALTVLTGSIWSTLWLLFGALIVSVVYNGFLKRRNPINIIVASPGGGAPIMVTWSAVTGEPIGLAPLLMAALVVLWTPIHIWSLALKYREDYERARVPMLPVVYSEDKAIKCIAATSVLLIVFSTALGMVLGKSTLYYLAVTPLNLMVLYLSFALLRKPSLHVAWRLFKVTSPYLAIVFASLLF